jgi:hypothetical protein
MPKSTLSEGKEDFWYWNKLYSYFPGYIKKWSCGHTPIWGNRKLCDKAFSYFGPGKQEMSSRVSCPQREPVRFDTKHKKLNETYTSFIWIQPEMINSGSQCTSNTPGN